MGRRKRVIDDTDAIYEAERRVGADGTDEYFREMTTPEAEREPEDDMGDEY